MKKIILLISIILIIMPSIGICKETDKIFLNILLKVSSDNYKDREYAFNLLIKNRKMLADKLINNIKSNKNNPRVKELSINLLGYYRIEEGINILLDNLHFQTTYSMKEKVTETMYPSVKALIKIGSPVPDAIISYLTGEEDESTLRLLAVIIKNIDGVDLGIRRIELSEKKFKNSNKEASLNRLKDILIKTWK